MEIQQAQPQIYLRTYFHYIFETPNKVLYEISSIMDNFWEKNYSEISTYTSKWSLD